MPNLRFTFEEYQRLAYKTEVEIQKLALYYRKFYNKLLRLGVEGARQPKNLIHYDNVMKQLDGVFNEVEQETIKRIQKISQEAYKSGKVFGGLGLQTLDISDFNRSFSIIDKREVEAAVFKSYANIGAGLTRTKTKTISIIDDVRNEVLDNIIIGKGAKPTAKQLAKRFKEKNISKIITQSGRQYKPDAYALMIMRTETMKIHNDANRIMMIENGQDLLIISNHVTTCDFCRDNYEGKIYSISGKNKRYKHVSEMKNGGPPFHNNCRHVELPYMGNITNKIKKMKQDELTCGQEKLYEMIDKGETPEAIHHTNQD